MIRTFEYKMYNNESYQKKFDKWIGTCRLVYNLALETKDYAYRQFEVNMSSYDLIKQLPELKKEFKWIGQVGSQTLQDVIERLDKSYQSFFKGGGFPKWAKRNKYVSFKFKQGVKETDKGFFLPKFGEVKVFNKKRKVNGTIKGAIIIKKADGLYVQIVFETNNIKNNTDKQGVVAIDMGLKYFCVTSDGEYIHNPKHLDKHLKKLRVESRSLSRKKKGSNNWRKQVIEIKKVYKKVSDTRNDFLHKTSTELSKFENVICEDLNISNMVKNKRLARHILDCSWGKFFEMLNYKTNLVKVNPKYTSQKCSGCGHIAKENRPTQSIFKCVECGFEDNADYQATLNILKLGHQLLYDNVGQ